MAWRTISDLAKDLEGVITPAGIKAAAQRVGWAASDQVPPKVYGVRRNGRAWELDDESDMVRKWYEKKALLEAGHDALAYQSEAQGRIEALETDRKEAERELEELRSDLSKAKERIQSLTEALEGAQKALSTERDKTSALQELAEERASIISSLTVALNAVTVARETSPDATKNTSGKSHKAASKQLEGSELLDAWKQYTDEETAAGRRPSKAAFARLHGMAASTFKGRLATAQQQQNKA